MDTTNKQKFCLIIKNLAFLGRFIDTMLRVWTGPEEKWPSFKGSLQGFGKLLWIYSELSSSVVFLDITLSFTAEKFINDIHLT
jgi:hypothetical protein